MVRKSAEDGATGSIWRVENARVDRRTGTLGRVLAVGLVLCAELTWTDTVQGALIWSDLGTTPAHETGTGGDILGGVLQRDDASSGTLYFKFHVEPLSDGGTEPYFAAFQLFQGGQEHLAVGNALGAWAYSAFGTCRTAPSNQPVEYIDLKSSHPEPSGVGTFYSYELPHWGIERTIVFKVQYAPGVEDDITVWLDPDLSPGATENTQPEALTTRFKANASFDQIRLRHGGGGQGWVFSEMAIGTSFGDFVNTGGSGPGQRPFSFRSWQQDQGLPENYVRALAQTADGYIWVGTGEGVCRFDGMSFFSLGPQEEFQGGPVQVLHGDSRGALWIGSAGGGLSSWQGGKLRHFTASEGLPFDSITALAEDTEGRMWVGTQAGLVVYQDGRFSTPEGAGVFASKPITALYQDSQGAMWVGATGAGVFSCRNGRFEALRDPAMDNLLQDPHCLLVDHTGRVWIGAGDTFVVCHDQDGWRRFGIPRRLASHRISTLAEQSDGTVWAGSAGEGLFEFKAGQLVVVNASSGLSDNLIEALMVDREGKLWVGTHGGLNLMLAKKLSVLSHNDGLNYGAVQGCVEIKPGLIWAAQPDGIYQWDGTSFRRLMLAQLSTQEPLVGALLAGRDGSCWIGGAAGLLHFRNPQAAEVEGGRVGLTNLDVRALAQDPNGVVWVGTSSGEIWRSTEGGWTNWALCPGGHTITAIATGTNGPLYVGTEGDGLYRIKVGVPAQVEKVNGLPGGWIRTLFLDGEGTLWIGTGGDGLSRLQNGRISTFTMREGLPDNAISQILEGRDGDLWLGGDRGIFRVKKHDLSALAERRIPAVYPQIYGLTDGMLSEECSSGFSHAGLCSHQGLLWFPTLKGIVLVDPLHIVSSPGPAVVLEQVLVDGIPEPTAAHRPDEKLSPAQDGDSTESLRLSPGRHTLEFRYTGLTFDGPERVRFRYRLEGLDPGWLEAGTRRVAFYSFVPPGDYRFQVIACNGDGVWNEVGDSLRLSVLPHFWQTQWFVAAMVLGTVIVGAGGSRFVEKRRTQQRLKRLEQEGALERERTRIAQDLHDRMGARMCRISFLSEHARRSPATSAELQEELRSISDDSREVLQSLDEIVWAVDPQKDTLDHLVSYIAQYAQEYFHGTGIECELELPAKLPLQPLSSQTRHHLFLSVHEALTNVLKHSEATRARIVMTCRGNIFEITISDNGKGFDPGSSESTVASAAAGFCNGLGNMRRRLTEMGGRCEVRSQSGKGTSVQFWLSFPEPLS